jgi:hypothetical protein
MTSTRSRKKKNGSISAIWVTDLANDRVQPTCPLYAICIDPQTFSALSLNSGSNTSCGGIIIVCNRALHISKAVTITPAGHYFSVTILEVIARQKIVKAAAASGLKCFRIRRTIGIWLSSIQRAWMVSWVILSQAFFRMIITSFNTLLHKRLGILSVSRYFERLKGSDCYSGW